MSITMNLYYTGKNGSAHEFVKEMEESNTAALIRREEGNERYEYFVSLNDPETILLIDSWKDQESLDAHHASAMMKTIVSLRDKYDLHMRVERYVSDQENINRQDESFIRK